MLVEINTRMYNPKKRTLDYKEDISKEFRQQLFLYLSYFSVLNFLFQSTFTFINEIEISLKLCNLGFRENFTP